MDDDWLTNPLHPASPLNPLNPANPLSPLNPASPISPLNPDNSNGVPSGVTHCREVSRDAHTITLQCEKPRPVSKADILLVAGIALLVTVGFVGLMVAAMLWTERRRERRSQMRGYPFPRGRDG